MENRLSFFSVLLKDWMGILLIISIKIGDSPFVIGVGFYRYGSM